MKKVTELSTNEAIVLQQVHHDGEDDTSTLANQLGMSRHHIVEIIVRLKQKGLVGIDGDSEGVWVHLTRKGREVMRYMWPEAHSALAV